ncbi:CDGSH iron-sulfur domain-containing protein [Streptomyces sp. enrichment culture]|uniref:CDGSH iron-sulfur domain-containing protein n=1 Tax=Streptomyces sp. enrichment culture TaxID=1795815 RepID=UPI003F569DA3
MPNSPSDGARPSGAPRRVKMQRRGPLLVEGPVEVELEDGTTVRSDRFRVALCTCRRSRRFPWCDTSHRARSSGPSDGPPPAGG